MTLKKRLSLPRVAVLAIATLTFGAACGSAGETATTQGETQSDVVSGESSNSGEGSAAASPAKADAEAVLKVAEQGFTQLDGGEYGTPGVSYGIVIKNSGDAIATNGQLQISFTDSSGTVVDTREEYITAVLPQSSVAVGDFVYDASGVTKMKVQLLPGDSENLEDKKPVNFKVSNVTTKAQEFGGHKTTATVSSPFTKDLKDLRAVAIYRDASDKIIGGAFTFLNFVPAGGDASVSIDNLTEGLTPASTDVYVEMSALTLLD